MMNKTEKEVVKKQLTDEEKALKELEKAFKQARKDVRESIKILQTRQMWDVDNLASIINQKKYQKALEKQLTEALKDLQNAQYTTLNAFLEQSYQNGYLGSMYTLQRQGIPITMPINKDKMVKAITTDSKLSVPYYQLRSTPENIKKLKNSIRQQLTVGIASGKSWSDTAVQIALGMNSPFNRALSDAMRIVRTEGHRINQQGYLDASQVAKEKGADIVKQWDATLDSKTRPAHQVADGQIRELDEPFLVMGEQLKAPSIGGSASNVINCRCQMLQRAKWMLDESELQQLKDRAEFFGLDKSDSFKEFSEKYLNLPYNADSVKVDNNSILGCGNFTELNKYLKDNHGFELDKEVLKLDFPTVREAVDGIEKVINEFPVVKGYLKGIGTHKSGVMCASFSRKINFNPKYYQAGNPSVYNPFYGMVTGNVTGFHPKNNTVGTTASHEMGHILERYMIDMNKENKFPWSKSDAWRKSTESKALISEACKKAKKTKEGKGFKNKELKEQISGYALKNDSECLAEAVADYMANGENASVLSKEIWKLLKERLV